MSRSRLLQSLVLAAALLLIVPTGLASLAGEPGSGGPYEDPPPSKPVHVPPAKTCPDDHPRWRNETTVYGVHVRASQQCEPDNPKLVAASVVGTDKVPQEDRDTLGLHEDAVVKSNDRDGDGDPDVINITLEVNELNGWSMAGDVLMGEGFEIAPGIAPPMWVFSPKTTIHHAGEHFFDIARAPSVPIRVEVNDTVNIELENTHYFPHTIHLHGTDHPFQDARGEGNDGVPHFSEKPVMPGGNRTYTFTPRVPGTNFYHCHVQPHVHVKMGLGTIIIVEEERDNNTLQTFNFGGGEVRHPSKASQEDYDGEHDLVYQDIDKELNEIVRSSNDPRVVAKEQNREYDATDADADYFLLNGRSFPYTLRESQVIVEPNERVKLRVINAGESPLSLHTHGHKVTVSHTDGVPDPAPIQRDVVTVTAAQRVDLVLNTTDDGLNSYGSGVWFMHDHREEAVTTDGIGPGGDISLITYASYINETTHMPETAAPLNTFFTPEYYRGEIPVWHGLGGESFLGEIAAQTTEPDDGEKDNLIPGPGAGLGALAVLGAALVLARRKEGSR